MIDGQDDCTLCDDLGHLLQVYSWWDSLPAVQRTAHRLLSARKADAFALSQLALAAVKLGDTASAQAWNRRLVAVNGMDRLFTSEAAT